MTWESATLEDIAEIVGGGTPRRSNGAYFGRFIDWVTPTDLPPIGDVRTLGAVAEGLSESGLAKSSAKRIPPGAVLFSSRASIGKIAVTDRECATNQGFANFIPRDGMVDSWFLAYLLSHHTPDIVQLAGETTYKEVSRSKLRGFSVQIPPIDEQRRIVGRIKEMFERVDEIRTLREQSLHNAQSLESAVFGDFISDLTASSSTNIVTLGAVLVRAQYGTSVKANANGDGVPILRMGNVKSGHLDVRNLKHIPMSERELAKYRLNDGDILFNRTNSLELVGKSAVFDGLDGDWVFASYLVRLEVDRDKALPEYVNAAINSRLGREFVYRTARRAIGMVNINARQIREFEFPLPSLERQHDLVERMRDARHVSMTVRDDLRIEPVNALREAILRKAFAGEL